MPLSRRELIKSLAALPAAGSVAGRASADVDISASASWRPRESRKPPNIVLAVLDDVGFSDLGCYGSEIDTQCIDGLAEAGVRFNNFHVTALCSPTRACLFTGQNAHRVGVGNIAEWGRPLPGYRGYIRDDVELLPSMLRRQGYSTVAIGKWHLSMVNDQDAMGPFDHWPTGRGFQHWYGFHGSAVDHFHPELFRNHRQVYPDKTDEFHLTENLIDEAIGYLQDHRVAKPDQPLFLYLGLGACHFPFHAPDSYLRKYRGRFDLGYDSLRPQRFDRQKQLGVVPKDAVLTPRPIDTTPWSALPKGEKAFSARTMEAFAAMLDHADDQLQRLVDALRASDELDNTIFMVMSDNGAGGGYHRAGVLDVRRVAYINEEPVAAKIRGLDLVGTEKSSPLYSTGWSFLGNTPLKRRKGDTYEGGTRAPLIVHWPASGLEVGGLRSQYHHVTDVLPTLLELIESPEKPAMLDGTSFAYALDSSGTPTQKKVQHYETAGDRAIWAVGWKAVTLHRPGEDFDDDIWSLYHSDVDFSESKDLAEVHPERLAELIDLWQSEAQANQVLPLDDDLDGLYAKVAPRPRVNYTFYPGQTRYNRLSAPDIYRYNFRVTANLRSSGDGVIFASGDSAAGYELFILNGYLHFVYVHTREEVYRFRSESPIPDATRTVLVDGQVSGRGNGAVTLYAGGEKLGDLRLPKMWKVEALNAGVRCGENRGAPISFGYAGSFPMIEHLEDVSIDLDLTA